MMGTLRVRMGDAVAKLVLLPVVGVSLCGAVTIMLGLQWMEALQRQRRTLKWRARLGALMLTLLLTLLPSKRLEAAVMPYEMPLETGKSELLNSGDKRDAEEGDIDEGGGSYSSRPLKRQRSEPGEREAECNERDEGDEVGDEEKEDCEETLEEEMKTTSPRNPRVRRRVFIWDLDETLVLFASLYTGTFAQTHGKEIAPGVALGEQMMTFLLAMLEKHFFFSDLHDADVDHIAHVANSTAGSSQSNASEHQPSVQERYERIREIYERRGHVDFLHDTSSEWFAIRGALIAAIDNFSTGWLLEARQVLELIAESAHSRAESTQPEASPETVSDDSKDEDEVENVNVLVTNTQLVPALCKCLIYQLDTFFPIDRVYSSAKVHKYRCFEAIMEKYEAPDVEFVAIGDGLEEEQVSLALGLEFHKIRSLVDLKRLRYDLQLVQVNSNAAVMVDSAPAVAGTPVSVASSPVGQTAVV
ncbi:Eyes absent family protein [Phytophthora palmivora]|uniref:protein-tyrosine-phosphatase n=1 Tax=Phytophthora palmivora TaxID=4796 RepID=A0A2P4YIX4_9STRA|nr:Eyes absent family protein [Phytophthora palmivora]